MISFSLRKSWRSTAGSSSGIRPKPTSIRPAFKAAICSKLVSSIIAKVGPFSRALTGSLPLRIGKIAPLTDYRSGLTQTPANQT